VPTLPDSVPFAARADTPIEGNIDRLDGKVMHLWCQDVSAPDRAVLVDILVNGRLFGRFVASEYRPDLEVAGKGSGHHGLTVDFSGSQMIAVDEAVLISACAADTPGRPFSSIELRPTVADNLDLTSAAIEHLQKHIPRLVEELYGRGRMEWGFPDTLGFADRVAAPIVQPMETDGPGLRRVTISKYANFARQRFRVEDQFKVGQASIETDNYIKWYLEVYLRLRADQRAPLSSTEIAYLNELIVYGGQQYHLSRVTWTFLLDDKVLLSRLNLNSPDSYLEVIYWWSIQRSRELWAEDCLVTSSYIQALSAVADRWRTSNFPLSRFMELYFSRRIDWHFLNLEHEQDRSIFYALLLLDASRQPSSLQYIPHTWIERLLQPRYEGTSMLEGFLRQVTEPSPAIDYVLNYKQAIRAIGFDLDRRKSTSVTTEGHRVANVGLRPEIAAFGPVSVQVIGPLQKASGLGQATRLSYDALVRHHGDCSAYDFDLDNPAPIGSKRPSSPLRRAKVNLIHLNAESIPLPFAFLPDVFTDSYNIGYFFWELDSPASCHSLALELLDEVWVSSQYGVDQYTPFATIPVTKISMSYEDVAVPDRQGARAYVRSLLGYGDDCFVFFAAFDSFSFIQRKNPQAVVKAFIDAFPAGANVRLVLKTHNRDFINDPVQRKIWQLLDEAAHADPRIAIINETLPYEQLLQLKTGCDCYVSLHRSEGWGFGMIEAMHLGVAVLATGYSGNTEFCSPDTCWIVGHTLRPVGPGDYIFVEPGQVWAEPDHADAVRQMRAVVSNVEEREQRTAHAKAFVDQHFSPTVVAQRYSDRLAHIASQGGSRVRRAARPAR
jgi:glycosyltransferase involved in cell wall biosynthesis